MCRNGGVCWNRRVFSPLSGLRRILFASWLALAIVLGQQAVVLHDIAHATGHKQESTPGKTACDKCFACAELSGAMAASIIPVAVTDSTHSLPASRGRAAASAATWLAYRSQAPPLRT